jgi:hypothetical protein
MERVSRRSSQTQIPCFQANCPAVAGIPSGVRGRSRRNILTWQIYANLRKSWMRSPNWKWKVPEV